MRTYQLGAGTSGADEEGFSEYWTAAPILAAGSGVICVAGCDGGVSTEAVRQVAASSASLASTVVTIRRR